MPRSICSAYAPATFTPRDALRLVEEGVGVDLADIRLALFVEHVDAAVIQPEDGGAALGGAQERRGRRCRFAAAAQLDVGAEIVFVFAAHTRGRPAADDEDAAILPRLSDKFLIQVRVQAQLFRRGGKLRLVFCQTHLRPPAAVALFDDDGPAEAPADAARVPLGQAGVRIITERRGEGIGQVQPLPPRDG